MRAGVQLKGLPELKSACIRAAVATDRTVAYRINKALKNVAFKAMQYTKHSTPTKIKNSIRRDKILIKMAVRALVKRGVKATRAAVSKEAKKIERIRVSRRKAIVAGWIPAVQKMGGEFTKIAVKQKPGSSTAQGKGVKATEKRTQGAIANTLVTRNTHGTKTGVKFIKEANEGLDRAVHEEAKQLLDFAARREYEAAISKEIRIFIV